MRISNCEFRIANHVSLELVNHVSLEPIADANQAACSLHNY